MISWLIPVVGEKAAKPVFFALLALLLVGGGYALSRCTSDNKAVVAQVEQTNRSGNAVADAAKDAINTIGNRTASDEVIDAAVGQAMENVDNAQSPDDIRAAVLAGVCGQASHRSDPACAVR